MALLNERLSVWELGFRWAGLTPGALRLGIPAAVEDHFRALSGALLNGELVSRTLPLESAGERMVLALIDCVAGSRYSRRVLKSTFIERRHFKTWCEWRGLALPEFWFPPGWQTDGALHDHPLIGSAVRVRMACQQIALTIWQRQPSRTIESVAADNLVQTFGGARPYPRELVRRWLLDVAPPAARERPLAVGAQKTRKSPLAGAIAG